MSDELIIATGDGKKTPDGVIIHRSLHLVLPSQPPYGGEHDLASFVGTNVRPIADRLTRFWFSQYGQRGALEVKFRFTTERFEEIRPHIEALERDFKHGEDGCGSYSYEKDLGEGRMLSVQQTSSSPAQRGRLAYEFLTAGARLFIDNLVPDGIGWKPEQEQVTGFNRETPMETFHHLFCNMANVPTWAALLQDPSNERFEIVSVLQAAAMHKANPALRILTLPKIVH